MKIHLRFLGNSRLGQLIRTVILLIYLVFVSLIAFLGGLIFLLLRKDQEARLRVVMGSVHFFCRLMHDTMIGQVIIKGKENLNVKPPVIFVSNHESYWDGIFLPVMLCPTVFVVKRYVVFLPIAGWTIAITPIIKVDSTRDKRNGKKSTLEKTKKALQQGLNILFFAQGTRIRKKIRVPFRKGAAILATETNTPIVPIAVNSLKIWPNNLLTKTGDVTVSIGKMIRPEGKTVDQLTEELENWIYNERAQLDD